MQLFAEVKTGNRAAVGILSGLAVLYSKGFRNESVFQPIEADF